MGRKNKSERAIVCVFVVYWLASLVSWPAAWQHAVLYRQLLRLIRYMLAQVSCLRIVAKSESRLRRLGTFLCLCR